VEAEEATELSIKYEIAAVPLFLFFKVPPLYPSTGLFFIEKPTNFDSTYSVLQLFTRISGQASDACILQEEYDVLASDLVFPSVCSFESEQFIPFHLPAGWSCHVGAE